MERNKKPKKKYPGFEQGVHTSLRKKNIIILILEVMFVVLVAGYIVLDNL